MSYFQVRSNHCSIELKAPPSDLGPSYKVLRELEIEETLFDRQIYFEGTGTLIDSLANLAIISFFEKALSCVTCYSYEGALPKFDGETQVGAVRSLAPINDLENSHDQEGDRYIIGVEIFLGAALFENIHQLVSQKIFSSFGHLAFSFDLSGFRYETEAMPRLTEDSFKQFVNGELFLKVMRSSFIAGDQDWPEVE